MAYVQWQSGRDLLVGDNFSHKREIAYHVVVALEGYEELFYADVRKEYESLRNRITWSVFAFKKGKECWPNSPLPWRDLRDYQEEEIRIVLQFKVNSIFRKPVNIISIV